MPAGMSKIMRLMEMYGTCLLIYFIFVCKICLISAQDVSLYGLFEFAGTPLIPRKVKEIYSKCYQGFGFTTCSPNLANDDVVLGYNLPYYNNMASIQGQLYCMQCCGTPPDYTDTWDLSCTLDAPNLNILTTMFGYELRLARKQTETDTEVVRCPFARKQCDFSTDFAPVCDRSNDTFLHGYTLTIEVEKRDLNFAFWRGVRSCEFNEIDERSYPLAVGESFREIIIMKHKPIDTFDNSDAGKVAIIVVSCFFVAYIALYFLRRKRCEYCQGKLVLSPRLCYKCIIVGAEPPDPVLLKALEDRGLHMQGKPPERLGCLQRSCVGCLRCTYQCLTCRCCCAPCAWFCRTCCCCCKCCHCCEPKPAERIVPDDVNAMSIEQIAAMEAALKMERGDAVEAFDALTTESGPETTPGITTEQPFTTSGKGRSKKNKQGGGVEGSDKKISFKPTAAAAPAKKKSKNPNVLEYPKDLIYKAVKHPSVY